MTSPSPAKPTPNVDLFEVLRKRGTKLMDQNSGDILENPARVYWKKAVQKVAPVRQYHTFPKLDKPKVGDLVSFETLELRGRSPEQVTKVLTPHINRRKQQLWTMTPRLKH